MLVSHFQFGTEMLLMSTTNEKTNKAPTEKFNFDE